MSEYIYGSIGDPLANALGEIYLPRAEVVRCHDCRYLNVFYPFDVYRMKKSEIPEYHCESSQFSNWDFPIEVEPDGFCKWGERRAD